MKESTIVSIWQNLFFQYSDITTVDGLAVEILFVGEENKNAGPDFLNAKIRIDDTLWFGTVEIHVKSSDWNRHKHFSDKKYNSVILHVVFEDDCVVFDSNKRAVPCLELKTRINKQVLSKIYSLHQATNLPCATFISEFSSIEWLLWKERLLVERFLEKEQKIEELLSRFTNDWEYVLFILLARALGLKVNANNMERLAMFSSLKTVKSISSDLTTLEAYLFGIAGFLDENLEEDVYFKELKETFTLQNVKFNLLTLEKSNWNLLRLRPASFPTIRIAQLAVLAHSLNGQFANLIVAKSIDELKDRLRVNCSDYWSSHYFFGKASKGNRPKKIGENAINNLIINAIVPFMFVYGRTICNNDLKDKAIKWIKSIQPEHNKITKVWKTYNVSIQSAGESQALHQLYTQYCKKKKCLSCRIGRKIIYKQELECE